MFNLKNKINKFVSPIYIMVLQCLYAIN